jgi:hypothetical protein
MDNIFANRKVVDGKTLVPQMYGDPRGYKHNGPAEWYLWGDNLFEDRQTEVYLWSMNRKDLERVPIAGWLGFLEGKEPDYPPKALQADFESIRLKLDRMNRDETTPDTRLADYLLDLNPAATDSLVNLMLGGYFARGRIWTLHSRFRYFDPENRRAGAPPDVGALVEKLGADSATLVLVNLNPVDPRTVVVQAGGYGEHRFEAVGTEEGSLAVGGPLLTVRLEAGCGARLHFRMSRYANLPTLAHPWDRGWFGKH